jgi:hypothetical protein
MLIDNYPTCIHASTTPHSICKATLPSSQVQLGAAGAIDTPDLSVVSSQPCSATQPRVRACSFHNIVSLEISTSKTLPFSFHFRLPVLTGFSYRFSGLVVSERARYRNRAKGACDDLILLLHNLHSHWSNASSSFIIPTFNRHKAETGDSAIIMPDEMCLQITLRCGRS